MASLAEKNEQAAEQTFAEGGELNQNKASLEYCLAKNVSLRGQPLQAKIKVQPEKDMKTFCARSFNYQTIQPSIGEKYLTLKRTRYQSNKTYKE